MEAFYAEHPKPYTTWSARRNAAHAIVVFMDIRTKLIFDYVIVSRNPDVSDIDFYDTSNMMENAAVKEKKKMNIYKIINFWFCT